MAAKFHEIETFEQLDKILSGKSVVSCCAFRKLDFEKAEIGDCRFENCVFLGCNIPKPMKELIDSNCIILPPIDNPFTVFPSELYNASTLYAGFDINKPETISSCYDGIVYSHFLKRGKTTENIKEMFIRSLHDTSIREAMNDLLDEYDERKVVGIMGGHGMLRTDKAFREVVLLSKKLTENGCLMVSGGGPGVMEATHIGAWFAGRTTAEVDDALQMLSAASNFKHEEWLSSAFRVLQKYPQNRYRSLGVPTWLYGHEPATPFASHIAKFFENSIREDGILTIAKGGIFYSLGSAGTMQEIFQDAAQNHYQTFGYSSPMIFFGKEYWTEIIPVYPFLNGLMQCGGYKNLLISITDDISEAEETIMKFGNEKNRIQARNFAGLFIFRSFSGIAQNCYI